MGEEKREFKGVWFPRELWLNEELTILEKAIYIEIDSLDNKETHCIASNEYFADFCKCSERQVSRAINKLLDLKMVEILAFDGRHRTLKVTNVSRQTRQNVYADTTKCLANNINNNKENNLLSNDNKLKEKILYEKIIDYLNKATGKNYKATSKATQKHIKARLSEGYTLDDFKKVIDNKVHSWKGTKWEEYLRPSTLFNSEKFEGYLNEGVKTQKQQARVSTEKDADELYKELMGE